jgi:hypothetical protein
MLEEAVEVIAANGRTRCTQYCTCARLKVKNSEKTVKAANKGGAKIGGDDASYRDMW